VHLRKRGAQRGGVERCELRTLGGGVGARVERKVCVLHGRVAYQAAWANRTHSSCSRRTWTIRWRSSGAQFAYVR